MFVVCVSDNNTAVTSDTIMCVAQQLEVRALDHCHVDHVHDDDHDVFANKAWSDEELSACLIILTDMSLKWGINLIMNHL